MPLTISNTGVGGSFTLVNNSNQGRFTTALSTGPTYTYNSTTLLSWPTSGSYTLYSGGFTNYDDGYTLVAIKLPVSMSTNNQSSINLFVSTNGYFTLTSGAGDILAGPTTATPATMAANPADNWLQPGTVMSDGDIQNVYYTTGSSDGSKNFIKLLIYGGTYQAVTTPKSWLANFYRDSTYQWLETRAKSNVVGNAGPYNATSVAQPSSTISRVWRGDLTGRNWAYMGTGSVQ
jgi:hypothetical protein